MEILICSRQHPHKLVGENCNNGICYIREFYTDRTNPTILSFRGLCIESCRKPDIPGILQERALLNINPFDLSVHGEDDLSRDIHEVRLCFQVIYNLDPTNRARRAQFEPIVSQPITSKPDVTIYDISDIYSPASGGKKIMIFCDKITKGDIEIRFYEEDANETQTLIGLGVFQLHNVHRNVAIAFNTPAYQLKPVEKRTDVFLEMVRKSDNERSNRIPFHYVPDTINVDVASKHQKLENLQDLLEFLSFEDQDNIPGNIQQHHNSPQQQRLQQLNLPQEQCNLPQQQHNIPQQQNLPQQYNRNLPQEPIAPEQFNQNKLYDPQLHCNQHQHNLHGLSPKQDYVPQLQPNDEGNILNIEHTPSRFSCDDIVPTYTCDDQLMLSASHIKQ